MVTVAIVLLCLGLGLLHRSLSRMRSAWLGGIVPALWVVAAIGFFVQGQVDSALDFVMAVVGVVALLRLWDEGRQARAVDARAT